MNQQVTSGLQRLEALGGRGMAALSPRAQLALGGRAQVELDGQRLDPGIQLLLRVMALRGGRTAFDGGKHSPDVVRAKTCRDAAAVSQRRTPVGAVSELEIDGAEQPLGARHYAPEDMRRPQPLIVFLHGGGFAVCDLETHDEPCRLLCRHAGVHVLAVDYRLAPEHPFPAAVDDALAAARWALTHAQDLGADPRRVGLAGDSAGGNLTAVVARLLSRGSGSQLALQVLIYPVTDLVTPTRSGELFAEGFFLTAQDRAWFERLYVPDGVDRADPRLSPLRAHDLHGLPPAIVITAGFDPLRDEGEAYAEALHQAGVDVVVRRETGLIHGFLNFTQVNRTSRDAVLSLAGMIRGSLPDR